MVSGVTAAGTPLGSFTAAEEALCTTGRQEPKEKEVMPGMNWITSATWSGIVYDCTAPIFLCYGR